ncbi:MULTISPECIES: cytochrome P450 [Rhodococcus]|jgi:cytochrome P450|uniref:Cytochrome P450 n=1 Tax=Rhodococcus oxybenzonivorans TaxID=1990687 RepID=A0AAE5A7K9_9NOCA|nr:MULTISPECIES: cytochrome P450 [Rhodococcus]MDV7241364.1 cytochrome P450 [Rhodococcus oxybenzonivorans]MDV7266812.1 cytochrome P450 [Rhodococcus oxybenzonivorans]MDV7274103.1 cytochrome P450 [Rhodococcus oxybenzonivorans]MDV7333644.1 cytochrome P450 [Rhodococcus oxybenzonivorans]MDV7343064.1 cytochrome P450 [Rhodococcus oxybenzonivorans]
MTATLSWIDEITMTELERNPYPVYERLRTEAPLAYLPVLGSYVATTAELCRAIATSPDFEGIITKAGGRTFGHPAVIGVNGDIHRDLRSMVDPALQPSEVDRWVDSLVRPIARRYVEQFENHGKADLVSQYCEPVSVRALGDLLGLNDVSSDTLRDWFHRLSNSFTNAGVDENGEFTNPEGFIQGDDAKAEIRAIVDPLIDNWIVNPDDSAISHWLHDGMPEGQVRERDYIYPTLFVFLLGAMQEPGHAMASTLVGLFSRPEQLEAVIDEPALIPRAISEGMRWTSPIWSATARISTKDVTVGDVFLPEGSVVLMSYGSANHDAEVYDAPTEYDMTRPPLPHLAFGAGQHACAGIYFANHVCRIGLEELFEAIPNLERDTGADVEFWGWGFRGPTALHATWEV